MYLYVYKLQYIPSPPFLSGSSVTRPLRLCEVIALCMLIILQEQKEKINLDPFAPLFYIVRGPVSGKASSIKKRKLLTC